MNTSVITLEGTLLADGQTLQLKEKLTLPPGLVLVTVQAAAPPSGLTMLEVLDRIHGERQERGHIPMTDEEMEAQIAQMRNEDNDYEERWRELWASTETKSEEAEPPSW